MRHERRTPIMYQEWRSLLFLHWKIDPEEIQSRIPLTLEVDTFEGDAYIGIVPFYMHGLRPKFAPPCPGISYFPELNLRTYVRDQHGRKGVWFFSLDAHSRISVAIARLFFGLPYHYARMSHSSGADNWVSFTSKRSDGDLQHFDYRAITSVGPAKLDSLSHFLVERYRLFTEKSGSLYCGELSHTPYELHDVEVSTYSTDLFRLNGFSTPEGLPCHMTYSKGVQVEVYRIRELEG